MLHKKLISILGCVFLVMICGCADNRAESDSQVIELEAYEDVKILDVPITVENKQMKYTELNVIKLLQMQALTRSTVTRFLTAQKRSHQEIYCFFLPFHFH